MEPKVVYKCTGTCGGVSFEEKKCGADTCEMHGHTLKAYTQCQGCAEQSYEDNEAHVCDMCLEK